MVGKSTGLLHQDVSRVETPGWLQTDMTHRGYQHRRVVSDLRWLHSIPVWGVVDRILSLHLLCVPGHLPLCFQSVDQGWGARWVLADGDVLANEELRAEQEA